MALTRKKTLVNPDDYVKFIRNTKNVFIQQIDLVKLNISVNKLVKFDGMTNHLIFGNLNNLAISQELKTLIRLIVGLKYLSALNMEKILNDLSLTDVSDNLFNNTLVNILRQKIKLIPMKYDQRTQVKQCSSSELKSLETAVKNSCRLDFNIFENSINELLSYSTETSESKKFILKLLEKYPDMYDVMVSYDSYSVSGLLIQTLYYEQQPNMLQQLYSYAVNYPLIIQETETKEQRRKRIKLLPDYYMSTLYILYGTQDLNEILQKEPHPLENYLFIMVDMKMNKLRNLAQQFGMKIPDSVQDQSLVRYILKFMTMYRHVITRSEDFPNIEDKLSGSFVDIKEFIHTMDIYTDYELIEFFGYTGDYMNRYHLLENILNVINDEGFMIFKNIDSEKAENYETTMEESLEDLPKPYIAFGTPIKYRVVSVDELTEVFSKGTFKRVGGPSNKIYSIVQIERLIPLLESVTMMNPQLEIPINLLISRIHNILAKYIKTNSEIDKFRIELNKTSEEMKLLVKDTFYKILFAGMYMRYWDGPGNNYPVEHTQNYSGFKLTSTSLLTLKDIKSQFNKIGENNTLILQMKRLPIIEYNNSTYIISLDLLFPLLTSIYHGNTCVISASRKIIQTASYYIMILYGEKIIGNNYEKVNYIP